jgi:hypothetical protein
VIAASTERKDKLNARGSQLALDYQWRKAKLEEKYKDALIWSNYAGKGFWWIHWNEEKTGRVQLTNPVTKAKSVLDLAIGDVEVEVGSPFEVLVADSSIARMSDQPEIMRVKMRDVEEMKLRYPELAHLIKPTEGLQEAFHFEKRIAQLTAKSEGMTLGGSAEETGTDKDGKGTNKVLVKELFCAPGGPYPQGRYTVVVGSVLAREE